ncbi:hypothetical protein CDAR_168241 [Caerostris darwini]|uniref:Uncharacterized protein n=1 Tax=Caerostris darwini TaxID=1538125 RepID=A0AAV4T6K6_9ARAC|nr:hypothetical protein CDAR_168241 [Caerostris darwini]
MAHSHTKMKGPAPISPDHNISILVHFMGDSPFFSPECLRVSPPGVIRQKYGWKSCGEEGVMRIFLYPFPPLIPIPFPATFIVIFYHLFHVTDER